MYNYKPFGVFIACNIQLANDFREVQKELQGKVGAVTKVTRPDVLQFLLDFYKENRDLIEHHIKE